MNNRYHITIDSKRTTVSLDNILSELLAIKLGCVPNTQQSHRQIRIWLELQAKKYGRKRSVRVSQFLQQIVCLEIADNMLSKTYWDWFLNQK